MHNVHMFRMEPHFLSIPLEEAMYCSNCNAINNSSYTRCGKCGYETLTKVVAPTGNPPEGPGSGPAPALAVMPQTSFEQLRRAA